MAEDIIIDKPIEIKDNKTWEEYKYKYSQINIQNPPSPFANEMFLPVTHFYLGFNYNLILSDNDLMQFDGQKRNEDAQYKGGGIVKDLYDAVSIEYVPLKTQTFRSSNPQAETGEKKEFVWYELENGGYQATKILQSRQKVCKIKFQFFGDNGITIRDRTPSYNAVSLFSRFEPIQIWQQGGALTVDLILKYVAIDPAKYNELWVDRMAGLFKALSQPNYPGGASYKAPPLLELKIGDLIDRLPCVMTSFSRSFEDRMFVPYEAFNEKNENQLYYFTQDTKSQETPANGVFLPKVQTFNISLTSAYPVHSQVDFMTAVQRQEGVRMLKTVSIDEAGNISKS